MKYNEIRDIKNKIRVELTSATARVWFNAQEWQEMPKRASKMILELIKLLDPVGVPDRKAKHLFRLGLGRVSQVVWQDPNDSDVADEIEQIFFKILDLFDKLPEDQDDE